MINICINMSMINFLLNVLATFTSGLYVIRLATYMSVYSLILYLDSIFDNRAMDVRIDDSVHVDPDSKILTLSTHDTEDEQKRFLVQAYLEKCEDGERNAVEE